MSWKNQAQPAQQPEKKGPAPELSGKITEQTNEKDEQGRFKIGANIGKLAVWPVKKAGNGPDLAGSITLNDGTMFRVALWKPTPRQPPEPGQQPQSSSPTVPQYPPQ